MVYYSSQHGLVSDANLAINASVVGCTNNTTAAQAFANLADGTIPTVLVVEGAYMIDQIRLKSNTTLRMLNGNCGFIQSSSSSKPMVVNYNQTAGAATDNNIHIVGGVINGNGTTADGAPVKDYHSNQGWCVPLSLAGVFDCTITGTKFRNGRVYLTYVKNADNVWFYGCEFRQNAVYQFDAPDPSKFLCHDGTKFGWGVTNSGVKTATYIDINDDWLSLCPNDGFRPDIGVDDKIGGLYSYDPYAGCGDITNFRASDITLVNCYHGIRILTHSHSVDDIIFERVTGNVVDFFACIDRYETEGVYAPNGFHANNGSITFDQFNITVSGSVPHYPYKNCGLNIDVPIKIFNFTNSNITNTTSGRKVIRMDTGANISNLFMNNFTVTGVSDAKTLIQENGGSAVKKSGNLYATPSPSVFANVPALVIGMTTTPFKALGLTTANIRRVFRLQGTPASYDPAREINSITDLEEGVGYYLKPKTDIDLRNHTYTSDSTL